MTQVRGGEGREKRRMMSLLIETKEKRKESKKDGRLCEGEGEGKEKERGF